MKTYMTIIQNNLEKVNNLIKFFSSFYKKDEEFTIYYGLDSAPLNHNGNKTIKSYVIKLNEESISKFIYFIEPFQKSGYGVFFTPNYIDGFKRDKNKVKRVSCLFADFDIKNLPKYDRDILKQKIINSLHKSNLFPSKAIETNNGLHCYWLTNDISSDMFFNCQEGFHTYLEQNVLPAEIVCDKNAKSINNLLRVPGFLHLKDVNNPFLISEIIINNKIYLLKELKTANYSENVNENNLFRNKRVIINPIVKKRVSLLNILDNISIPEIYFNKELNCNLFDGTEFFNFLREYDLREILGIKHNKGVRLSCRCPFHEDASASAIISKNDNGEWGFYCFSSNCSEGGKYIKVIDFLMLSLGVKKENQFLNIICKKLNISLSKKFAILVCERIKNNKNSIKGFEKLPHFRAMLNKESMRMFYFILDKFKQHSTSNDILFVDGNPCIFQAMSNIAKETGMDKTKVHKIVNLLCLLKFFNKMSFKKIPEKFVPKTIDGSKYDTQITYLSLPEYSSNFKRETNEECYFFIQNGIKTIKHITKKDVMEKLGKSYFNRCFSDTNWSILIHIENSLTYEYNEKFTYNNDTIDFSKDIISTIKDFPPNRKPRGSSLISFLKKNIEIDFGRKE